MINIYLPIKSKTLFVTLCFYVKFRHVHASMITNNFTPFYIIHSVDQTLKQGNKDMKKRELQATKQKKYLKNLINQNPTYLKPFAQFENFPKEMQLKGIIHKLN